jgi:hypothetical protein
MQDGCFNECTIEERVIIITCRLSFTAQEKNELTSLLSNRDFNWFEFAKLALYHKTLALAVHNIKEIMPHIFIPKYLDDVSRYLAYCTRVRNECNKKQVEIIQEALTKKNVVCIPVKGTYLIPNLYKNYSIRYSGDMDFLVRFQDTDELDIILNEIGYIKGRYDAVNNIIKKDTRANIITWKIYMSNLHPYIKRSDSEIFPYYKLDFRYALDDSLNKEPINEIINDVLASGKVKPAHYLVHLCTHFYDEAKYSACLYAAKDLNLIKFCDIREFILNFCNDSDINDMLEFVIRYHLVRAVYYTMYCLNEVYSDGYENRIMQSLNVSDESFLRTFGDNTLTDNNVFKKTFLQRLLSCGNADELTLPVKFLESVNKKH